MAKTNPCRASRGRLQRATNAHGNENWDIIECYDKIRLEATCLWERKLDPPRMLYVLAESFVTVDGTRILSRVMLSFISPSTSYRVAIFSGV